MSGEALLREIRSLRVLVAHPPGSERDELVAQLKRIGCQVAVDWPAPAVLSPEFAAVFCLVDERAFGQIAWFRRQPPVPVIAIMQFESPTVIRAVIESGATGIINKPIRPFGILSALIMARSIHRYEFSQDAKIAKLKETLRSRQIIDRAVRTLCQLKDIGEEDAYETIRQQATNKRLPMGVIADSILNASSILAPGKTTASVRLQSVK